MRSKKSNNSNTNFKDANLLIVDKKKKLVNASQSVASVHGGLAVATDEEGVLSIPPEDPPNNCKSKLSHKLY